MVHFQDSRSPAELIYRVKPCFEKSDDKLFKLESDLITNKEGKNLAELSRGASKKERGEKLW